MKSINKHKKVAVQLFWIPVGFILGILWQFAFSTASSVVTQAFVVVVGVIVVVLAAVTLRLFTPN